MRAVAGSAGSPHTDYSIQLKEARDQILQLSNRDALTGALNRARVSRPPERAMDRPNATVLNPPCSINVDQFANVNDKLRRGRWRPDDQTISRRLINKMRSTDSIARLGTMNSPGARRRRPALTETIAEKNGLDIRAHAAQRSAGPVEPASAPRSSG